MFIIFLKMTTFIFRRQVVIRLQFFFSFYCSFFLLSITIFFLFIIIFIYWTILVPHLFVKSLHHLFFTISCSLSVYYFSCYFSFVAVEIRAKNPVFKNKTSGKEKDNKVTDLWTSSLGGKLKRKLDIILSFYYHKIIIIKSIILTYLHHFYLW